MGMSTIVRQQVRADPFAGDDPPAAVIVRSRGAGRHVLREHEWETLALTLRLSPREIELIHGVFDGLKDGSIARGLGLSAHTVRTYFERLYRKLHVKSRAELVLRVFEAYLLR